MKKAKKEQEILEEINQFIPKVFSALALLTGGYVRSRTCHK